MSTTVDSRVLEMRFDNRQFERNVSDTISTLDKLKQKLNFSGASKGLEDVNSAARKVDLSAISGAAELVTSRLSNLGIVGTTWLVRLANQAYTTGERMAKALTVDPIMTGFSEYETQINAVQTILANTESKGTTLQQVNAALDTLNEYADKTIYNFTEMTKNIGTFTAAGVDLDTSVKSIQGIANLAAVSGSTSQQASTAMYQLSQALAAGRVSLMDWNSVVNAGMGGQVFQDALKRTAKAMGTDVDAIIKKYGSFRESLTQGEWLTTDVLTKTLEQFTMAAEEGSEQWEVFKKSLIDDGYTAEQAEEILKMANTAQDAATKVKTFTQLWDTLKESAQSGWTQTWEIIVGDFGEAKEFLTQISDTIGGMIGESAESRNALLSGGLSSGWKQLLGSGIADEAGYQDAIQEVAKEHGVALDEMILKEDGFVAALKAGLKDGTITSDMMSEAVTTLADKMRKMSAEELEAAGYTKEHIADIEKLESALKKGEISMDEFVKKIQRPSGRENLIESLWNSFEGLMNIVKPIKEAFREIFPPMTGEQLYLITVKIKELTASFRDITAKYGPQIKSTFKGVFSVLDIGWTIVKDLAGGLVDLFSYFTGFGGNILDSTASLGDWLVNLRDSIKEGDVFGKTIDRIVEFLGNGIDKIKEFGSSLKKSFSSNDYSGFLGFLKGTWEFVKSIGSGLLDAFGGLGNAIANVFGENSFGDVLESGGLAVMGVALYKLINNLNAPFESFSDLCEGLTGEDGVLGNVVGILGDVRDTFKAYQQQLKAETLIKIATAIGILTASIFVISTIDPEKLGGSLAAMGVLFGELIGAMALFSKAASELKGVMKAILLMLSMATAMLILSGALRIIGSMKPEEMMTALLGVAGGLGILVGALHLMPERTVTKAAKAIRTLSISLVILGAAMKIFASMSWDEIGRGLAGAAGGLLALVTAVNLLPKDAALRSIGMVGFATSLVILASALKIMGSMKWDEAGRGLTALAGSLVTIAVAMRMMPKNMISSGVGLIAVATALTILGHSLKSMGSMSWETIGKGLAVLGGALLELSIGLLMMRNSIAGSAALLIAAGALTILTPTLKSLGEMSIGSIIKSLGILAGTFIILGVAGTFLAPLTPVLLSLAGTLALFGLAAFAFGAGLTLIGTGISAIATALSVGATSIIASITVIITGLLDLIPTVATKLGEAIRSFAVVIGDCAPQIAESVLKLLAEVLEALAEYAPRIADSLFQLLIGVLDVLAARMPELIVASVKVISAFFRGVVDALKSVDTASLLQGTIAVALLAGLMYALSGVAGLIPGAMIGVLGMGVIIAELALVLAAVGALAQIQGLSWLIGEGGNFLQLIGTAIGQFIGGLVGGIAQGVTSSLPDIATDLSNFMTNIQPFVDGAKSIDASLIEGVKALAGAVLMLTGVDIVNSLASFITGGSSLADFGEQLVPFGESMKKYGEAVSGVDTNSITASAAAAKALATVAQAIPKEGGLASLFGGETDMASFAEQLVPFGQGLKNYALAVAGIDAQAIVASATAAKAIVDMANHIPNEGGMIAWFTGENSLANFSGQLVSLGMGLKNFAIATIGIDTQAIISAAGAAKALADMISVIPNEGGLVAWLTGENSVSRFGTDLVSLGFGLRNFAIATTGVDAQAIIGAAGAAKALADMMNAIPNEGGLVAWLTGENSVSKFAGQLQNLGFGLKNFSIATAGINPESIIAAAGAAKALAQMTSVIPNEGGVVAWFTGESSIANFAGQLPILGAGLLGFSIATAGIDTESVATAANAAKTLAQMTATIPNEGGVKAWFTGESSVSKFAAELPKLGEGLCGFSTAVAEINAENITAAAGAAKALAEMTNVIPKEGGIKAWFTGETSIANFASKLPGLGEGLKGFSDSVEGISPENVTAAANAAKSLAQMAETTPKKTDKIVTFGENLVTFGGKLKSYFEKTSEITGETIATSSEAISSVKEATVGLDAGSLKSASSAINQLISSLNRMSSVSVSSVQGFITAMKRLGETNVKAIITAFNNAGPQLLKAGTNIITQLIKGVESQNDKTKTAGQNSVKALASGIGSKDGAVKSACSKVVNNCASAIKAHQSKFESAGKHLGNGLVNGIKAKYTAAYNAGYKLGQKAAQGEKDGQKSKSPSKLTYQAGLWLGEGLINGMGAMESSVYKSGFGLGDKATKSMSDAIRKVSSSFDSDMDIQPTIRPVLDLTNVKTGASAVAGLFSSDATVGVSANVGAISMMMNRHGQNGVINDVVGAIDKLREDVGNLSTNSYIINGLTYDDGSNIATAVKDLTRYARMERRV